MSKNLHTCPTGIFQPIQNPIDVYNSDPTLLQVIFRRWILKKITMQDSNTFASPTVTQTHQPPFPNQLFPTILKLTCLRRPKINQRKKTYNQYNSNAISDAKILHTNRKTCLDPFLAHFPDNQHHSFPRPSPTLYAKTQSQVSDKINSLLT